MITLYEINSTEALDKFEENKNLVKEEIDISFWINKRKETTLYEDEGILEVSVFGPLMRDTAPIDRETGATDYADLLRELTFAENDERVKGVLLNINSPGGMVNGNMEVAKMVENLGVPVVVYADGYFTSAAYKIGCGATHVVASPSCISGNIGTIMAYIDYSKRLEELRIELKAITNEGADYKSTHYLNSLTPEQEAFLQELINESGKKFQQHVLNNRPISPDSEVFKAGWYSGEKAVELGLVDELGNKETAMQRLVELMDTLQLV